MPGYILNINVQLIIIIFTWLIGIWSTIIFITRVASKITYLKVAKAIDLQLYGKLKQYRIFGSFVTLLICWACIIYQYI